MFPRVLAPNAALREQVIQTAGPSDALLERLKRAASCMGISEEDKEIVEVKAGPIIKISKPEDEEEARQRKDKTSRVSYLWAMLIARIYETLPLLCPTAAIP